MKKIVLIGDSIRKGYDKYVAECLKEQAVVYWPNENCRFAQYTLRCLHDWKKQGEWPDDVDLVHWNVGLWDTLTLYEDGTLTSPEYYREQLIRIDRRLKILFPNAKLIFATSTPVVEERFLNPKVSIRYNKDIEYFNEIAVKELQARGTVINDLYALAKEVPISYFSDMTHLYTKEGVELLGNAVVDCICKQLGIAEHETVDGARFVPGAALGQ